MRILEGDRQMDFLLSDEQKMIREAAADFAKNEIAPLAAQMDKEEQMDKGLLKKLGKLGYLGSSIPVKYGGTFTDHLTNTLISMELGKACAAVATTAGASSGLFGGNLAANGTEEQKEKYLPEIASGESIGCMGLTEPGAGSDAFSISTKAEKKGDLYILNGRKTFISNGPIADVALIYATVDSTLGTKGISAFIVERNFPGYSTGKKFEKMGLRGSPTGEIILEDCQVPAENLIGLVPGRGFKQMVSGLNIERIGWAAIAVGLADAAFGASFKYSLDREQFGAPIAAFQMIQDILAKMSIKVDMGKQSCIVTAKMMDKGYDIALAAAQCKYYCTEMVMEVATDGVQVHGGYGYTREFAAERYMRDAKVFAIGAGTNQIQKLLIARQLLSRQK